MIALATTLGAVLLAQTPPPASPMQLNSLWDYVVAGGPIMFPIGLCSLVALAVVIERSLALRQRVLIPPDFLSGLRSVSADRRNALAYCRNASNPAASILGAAIQWADAPTAERERKVEEAGRREVLKMRRFMRMLSVLPQVSTMLGLLGTIFGMIKTFQAVAASGQSLGKTEMLAHGIFEAWTATAGGLLVAIPVLVAYHVLLARIDAGALALDQLAQRWLDPESAGPVPAAATVVASPPPAPAIQPATAMQSPPMPVSAAVAAQ